MLIRSCKEVTRLVSESLEHELSLMQRIVVRVHIFMCQSCTRFRKQILFLREVLHLQPDLDTTNASPGLSPEARERIKQALRRSKR
ncbi:MAG: zf-HC2 domain-containing protein [Nitrospinota bacterium]|nr:MAG: zf-HC2 domain-containing protein [Nitrospinota bacterium]